jgi:hypothetical protein
VGDSKHAVAGEETKGMTRSMPLVVPALAEYSGFWRDCKGRVLKSYSVLRLKLDEAVDEVRDSDRLGVVRLLMLVVLLWARRGWRGGISPVVPAVPRLDVELWN